MLSRAWCVVLVGLCVAAGACGGDDDDASTTAAPATTEAPAPTDAPATTGSAATTGTTAGATGSTTEADAVLVVEGYAFEALSVPAGSVVRLENRDAEPHTVSSPDGAISFDAESETFVAPDAAGTYDYVCGVHVFMEGTLTVT